MSSTVMSLASYRLAFIPPASAPPALHLLFRTSCSAPPALHLLTHLAQNSPFYPSPRQSAESLVLSPFPLPFLLSLPLLTSSLSRIQICIIISLLWSSPSTVAFYLLNLLLQRSYRTINHLARKFKVSTYFSFCRGIKSKGSLKTVFKYPSALNACMLNTIATGFHMFPLLSFPRTTFLGGVGIF
jgi:hypothetical protein